MVHFVSAMSIVNFAVGGIFNILLFPFRELSPWFGMIFVSLITAFLMLWVFKLTSNQAGIRKAKNAIKAHLLELRLFKDNMRISLKAQGRIVRANMSYIACNSKPMLVMILPLLLILAQLNLWRFRKLGPSRSWRSGCSSACSSESPS